MEDNTIPLNDWRCIAPEFDEKQEELVEKQKWSELTHYVEQFENMYYLIDQARWKGWGEGNTVGQKYMLERLRDVEKDYSTRKSSYGEWGHHRSIRQYLPREWDDEEAKRLLEVIDAIIDWAVNDPEEKERIKSKMSQKRDNT